MLFNSLENFIMIWGNGEGYEKRAPQKDALGLYVDFEDERYYLDNEDQELPHPTRDWYWVAE